MREQCWCSFLPKLMTSNIFKLLSSEVVLKRNPSQLAAMLSILPTSGGCGFGWSLTHPPPTHVCSNVLDELNTLRLLLPEFDMSITASSDYELSPTETGSSLTCSSLSLSHTYSSFSLSLTSCKPHASPRRDACSSSRTR